MVGGEKSIETQGQRATVEDKREKGVMMIWDPTGPIGPRPIVVHTHQKDLSFNSKCHKI